MNEMKADSLILCPVLAYNSMFYYDLTLKVCDALLILSNQIIMPNQSVGLLRMVVQVVTGAQYTCASFRALLSTKGIWSLIIEQR